MRLVSSLPFWPIRDGIPTDFPPLERPTVCDVAVIGAGITGALIAWHLSAAGIGTLVLDRREAAHGSTAGSTSLLQYEIDEPLHVLADRLGAARAVRCYQRCGYAVGAIGKLVKDLHLECGFERKSSLFLASRKAHIAGLRREYLARKAAGFAVDWWSRTKMARASSLPHHGAILSELGAQVDSYRLTYGLLSAAYRAGAGVYGRTSVTRITHHSHGVELRTDRGLIVRARRLVIASGYEASSFLPRKAAALHSTYAMISHPLRDFAGWPAARCLIWETARPYCYLRTTEDNRAVIGGYDEPFRDPDKRDRLLGAKCAALQRRFHQWFPRIRFELASAWAGTFAETPHGLPYMGRHPRLPSTWIALGYGGNGITYSLLAAELIRDQILGNANQDEMVFNFAR